MEKETIIVIGCGAAGLTDEIIARIHAESGTPDVIIVDLDNTSEEELEKMGIPSHIKKRMSRTLPPPELVIPIVSMPVMEMPFIEEVKPHPNFNRGTHPKHDKHRIKNSYGGKNAHKRKR